MKKSIQVLILFFTFYLTACHERSSSINGYVKWKYNDLIGYRSDSGATVYLFPTQNANATPMNIVYCDSFGRYRIKNLHSGKYLLMIESNNTKNYISDNFDALSQLDTRPYWGFSFNSLNPSLFYTIQRQKKASAFAASRLNFIEEGKIADSVDHEIKHMMISIPRKSPLYSALKGKSLKTDANRMLITEVSLTDGNPAEKDFCLDMSDF